MRYILNSAVITAPGEYYYRIISKEELKLWFEKPELFISTIGYEETADALSLLAGFPIPVNRTQIKMVKGDEALVFRLVFPPGTPRVNPSNKGTLSKEFVIANSEIGILEKKG